MPQHTRLFKYGSSKTKLKHDKTLVQYVGDTLIDHLHGVAIGAVNLEDGTIRLVSTSTDVVHEIKFKRLR